MSYILDALKKSEKERSLGNVPTLGASGQQEERRVPLRWFLITVVVLALGIGIAGGWMLWSSTPAPGQGAGSDAGPGADHDAVAAADPGSAGTAQSSPTRGVPATEAPAIPVPITAIEKSVRSRIPEFRINVLSYSDNNSKRFVMIGQNIFKEGEEVVSGVVVDEIRNSDVVFRFEHVRFILVP